MAMTYKHGNNNNNSGGKVNCSDCRYIRVDKEQSVKSWTAYVCGNSLSDCYKALLNVTLSGEKQACVSWSGCGYGEKGKVKGGGGI